MNSSNDAHNKIKLDELALFDETDVTKPIRREDLVNRLLDDAKRFDKENHPTNTLLYGDRGCGKTTIIKRLMHRLSETSSIKVVYADCWRYYTRMAVYHLISQALGLAIPRRGLATDEVFDQIVQKLEQGNEKLLVILDSVDGLIFNHEQRLLYSLTWLNQHTRRSSLIVVCDDKNGFKELDERIRAKLRLQRISIRIEEHTKPAQTLNVARQLPAFSLDALSKGERLVLELVHSGHSTTDAIYNKFRENRLRSKRQIRNYLGRLQAKHLVRLTDRQDVKNHLKQKVISLA